MQYTCAYYPDPAMTLEEAQLAKMIACLPQTAIETR